MKTKKKCICCKKKLEIEKETSAPIGGITIACQITETSKYYTGKEHTMNAPQQMYNMNVALRYAVMCDDCYTPNVSEIHKNYTEKL